jgi:hypothetical protein
MPASTNTSSESDSQDSNFSAFGFTKVARRNFVVAVISILIISNGALFKYTMTLNDKIDAIRAAQVDSSIAMYNRLVNQIAERMQPVKQQVQQIQENMEVTDSLQHEIVENNRLKNTN